MSNKTNKKDLTYHIENLTIISEPSDITKLTEKTRVSIYYLNSLLSHEQIYLMFNSAVNSKFKLLAEFYIEEFNELESKLYFNNDINNPLGGKQLTEVLKRYIILKEKIDNLQLKMIEEMQNIAINAIDNILEQRNLSQHSLEVRASLLSNLAFKHSHKENKLDTYLFLEDEQEYDPTISFVNYDRLKVNNYNYLLKRDRKNLKYIFNKLTSIIFLIDEEDKKKELEALNLKQFSFNKQVTFITWIVGIATIIMLILAIIEFYNKK